MYLEHFKCLCLSVNIPWSTEQGSGVGFPQEGRHEERGTLLERVLWCIIKERVYLDIVRRQEGLGTPRVRIETSPRPANVNPGPLLP